MSYVYENVKLDRIIDGDTVVLLVDLGNKIVWKEAFRLNGIDCPERGQPGHDESTAHLRELLAQGIAKIETFKPDKYGRWLADLYISLGDGAMSVNTAMVIDGFAKAYFGGKKE